MLAILGGDPVIPPGMHGRYPPVGGREREYLGQVLDSGVLWGPWAPMTRRLEAEWAERTNVRHCVALNSGTAALHCALVGCGVGPGDEVIVPACSFIATASSVLMAGAVPIFVDVESESGNIDPAHVEAAITEQTRAIIVVHLHGLPADMDRLQDVAQRYGLHLLEDCAQAHGARYRGRPVGGLSAVGTFSLNCTKALAGPEGGLLTTNSDDILNRAAKMRVFGTEWRNGEQIVRDADSLGYNYRTNELSAAFTLARLEAFDSEQTLRVENAVRLINGIKLLPGVSVPTALAGKEHVFQMFRIRISEGAVRRDLSAAEMRERIVAALVAEGAIWWIWERKPLPAYNLFQTLNADGRGFPWSLTGTRQGIRYRPEDYPVSVATCDDSIFTSSHFPPNGPDLIDLYVEAFKKVWDNLDAVASLPAPRVRLGIQEPF